MHPEKSKQVGQQESSCMLKSLLTACELGMFLLLHLLSSVIDQWDPSILRSLMTLSRVAASNPSFASISSCTWVGFNRRIQGFSVAPRRDRGRNQLRRTLHPNPADILVLSLQTCPVHPEAWRHAAPSSPRLESTHRLQQVGKCSHDVEKLVEIVEVTELYGPRGDRHSILWVLSEDREDRGSAELIWELEFLSFPYSRLKWQDLPLPEFRHPITYQLGFAKQIRLSHKLSGMIRCGTLVCKEQNVNIFSGAPLLWIDARYWLFYSSCSNLCPRSRLPY